MGISDILLDKGLIMKRLLSIFLVILIVAGCEKSTKPEEEEPVVEEYLIQEEINESVDGDTIIVEPGKYVENIDFKGKSIVLGSFFLTTGDSSYIIQTIIDGNENGPVVKFERGEDSTAVLTGFTLTNGLTANGGGVYCNISSPRLENLIITDNYGEHGGGIYCYGSPSPSLLNIMISENFGRWGSGIYCGDSNPRLENVTITDNIWTREASITCSEGGGLYCMNSNPSLVNVTITRNGCNFGGGVFLNSSSPSMVNVRISENIAEQVGGGLICQSNSNPRLVNSVLSMNISDKDGGGIACLSNSSPSLVNVVVSNDTADNNGGGIYISNSNLNIKNTILWGNSPHEIYFTVSEGSDSVSISYSDIQDGEDGIVIDNNEIVNWLEGNLDEDPLFVDIENNDFHLTEDSPCIEAGNPDPEYNDIDGSRNDMGIYGGPNGGW